PLPSVSSASRGRGCKRATASDRASLSVTRMGRATCTPYHSRSLGTDGYPVRSSRFRVDGVFLAELRHARRFETSVQRMPEDQSPEPCLIAFQIRCHRGYGRLW